MMRLERRQRRLPQFINSEERKKLMAKFINDPKNLTAETLEGLALAHPDIIALAQDGLAVSRKLADARRVTVVTLGCGGSEPAMSGFVGEGMADVAVTGELFVAPGPAACAEALRLADKGQGVLLLAPNHSGFTLTAELALRLAAKEGIRAELVLAADDAAAASREQTAGRRGLVGCVALCKIAGTAAAAGRSLAETAALARRFAAGMASLAVAAGGFAHPGTGKAQASVPEGMLALGTGIHGEGGGELVPLKSADQAAALLTERLAAYLGLQAGTSVLLLVSGSGGISLAEQLILYRACHKHLEALGIEIAAGFAGELLTVRETAGWQLCLARLDKELLALWQAPCRTPYYKN